MRLQPWHILAGVVVVAWAVYGTLAQLVPAPFVFYDETVYFDAADSIASGDGFTAREEPYRRGALYPILLAPALSAFPDRELAYGIAKGLNALLFALTAVPVYLLARRVLAPLPSVAAAVLSVLVPSSVYVSVVMTESSAYFVFCSALYAMTVATERPTAWRQTLALASIAVAFSARPQFGVLLVAYLAALMSGILASGSSRRRSRRLFHAWPTAVGLVGLGVGAVLVSNSPRDLLGEYGQAGAIASIPNVLDVATWLVYLLAGLDLYLAVIPLAVAPIVLASFLRRGRPEGTGQRAFAYVFLSVNASLLLLGALIAVDYQDFGILGLHDRYLFYVAPLWLIVLVAWLTDGHRNRLATALGAVSAVLLAGAFPFAHVDIHNVASLFHAVGGALPAALGEGVSVATQRGAAVLISAVLVIVALRLPRRRVLTSIAAIVTVFALNAFVVWAQGVEYPADEVFSESRTDRDWVDAAVPREASVAMLHLPCVDAELPPDGFLLTEFFNRSVGRSFVIDGVAAAGAGPAGTGGAVLLQSGRAIEAPYLVAQSELPLRGRRIREGTTEPLVLWRVDSEARLAKDVSLRDLSRALC